jgi:hypothetical protein
VDARYERIPDWTLAGVNSFTAESAGKAGDQVLGVVPVWTTIPCQELRSRLFAHPVMVDREKAKGLVPACRADATEGGRVAMGVREVGAVDVGYASDIGPRSEESCCHGWTRAHKRQSPRSNILAFPRRNLAGRGRRFQHREVIHLEINCLRLLHELIYSRHVGRTQNLGRRC